MSNQITPFKMDGFEVTITPEAKAEAQKRIALCKGIETITDANQDNAAQSAALAKGLFSDAELTRKIIKEPYLRAGQLIDLTAKQFCAPLELEFKRIERMLGAFQQDKRARAEEEQRRREWEAGAAQREADRLQREAEAAKAAAEQARIEAEAAKGRDKKKAQAEADRAAAEAEKARKDALAAEFEAAEQAETAATVVHESATPIGAKVTPDQYEVEIIDLPKLVAFALSQDKLDELLKIEPRMKNLKDFIFFHNRQHAVPGTKVTPITRVSVRAIPGGMPAIG